MEETFILKFKRPAKAQLVFCEPLSMKTAKHTQHGHITGCSLSQLKMLQLALREKVVPENSPQAFQIIESKEYGASKALYELSLKLGLDKILYSRPKPWVNSVPAMIIGRIVYGATNFLSVINSTIVLDKIEEIRVLYEIQTVTFVGDRRRLTKHNLHEPSLISLDFF